MPADYQHLITTGHLMAKEREALGFLPQMMCARCGKHPVDLIWMHEPVDLEKDKKIPGSVWGKDIAVICPRCSVADVNEEAGK